MEKGRMGRTGTFGGAGGAEERVERGGVADGELVRACTWRRMSASEQAHLAELRCGIHSARRAADTERRISKAARGFRIAVVEHPPRKGDDDSRRA